jgi:hypothetical protein
MWFRIATAVAVGVIALALPIATAQQDDRGKEKAFKVAQYCVPDEAEPGSMSDLYCFI